ncbi:MAG: GNAT family N-acetyltransferase [Oscillospiraceae bacterium]|nr:GNAT family N-acetyltransferase [Oscillospiraceae bacterium]
MSFLIREAEKGDLESLLNLYTHLNDKEATPADSCAEAVFDRILRAENQHLLVAVTDGVIAATLTLTVLPGLTQSLRSYAVVEHVVTHGEYRRKGLSSALLAHAEEIARTEGCYKLMLITGKKEESVHRLYMRAGYSSEGKTAYVKPL